jgi:nitrilase
MSSRTIGLDEAKRPQHFRVAAVQAAPVYMDRDATAEKANRLIEEAARQGAEIVGFPECFIPGFPSWVYAASPNYDTVKAFKDYVENSVAVPSGITDDLQEIARRNKINIVMGMVERDPTVESALYITQLFIGEEGLVLGKHRKIVPTYAEKLLFASGDGSTLSVFKTKYGELGGLNCGEHFNPLARFALIAQNIKIHVASWPMPSVEWMDSILPCVRSYAYEAAAYVISSSGIVTPEIREELLRYAGSARHAYEPHATTGGGVGCIVNPFGKVLAQANPDREEIVYAECDISEHYKAKASHDVVGNYNRPEIFSLTINKRPFKLVTTLDEEAATEKDHYVQMT